MYKKPLFLVMGLCTAASMVVAQSSLPQRKFTEGLVERPFYHYARIGYSPISNGVHPPYRTFDGTNNNLGYQKAEWGATDVQLFRELPAVYGSTNPNNAMNGTTRPTARKISNVLCDEPVTQFNSRDLSTFIYVWGQFLDHDITLTPQDTVEYAPVLMPVDELLFTEPIPFFRSAVRSGTGVTNQRQQTNLNTSWIDGSVVYGCDTIRAKWLRTFSQGKMKTSAGNLLPWNTVNGEQTGLLDPTAPSMANDGDHTIRTFAAGDVRAAEHPGITALHTLFVREHNRICNLLVSQGYTNDEQIYQLARKQVGALIQAITYNEFLPAMGVSLSPYTFYKSTVCPDIANSFATAGYRIGHTMVADEIAMRDNNCEEVEPGELDLMDVFFNPQFVVDYGLEPFLRGFATHKQYETDTKVNSVLRNFLFNNPNDPIRFGLDLASLNIQRGRDHGLPSYNASRQYYTNVAVTKFSQITSDTAKASALQALYGSVNNIDLWVGILAEDRLANKSVGKTMHAMLKWQFERLRDGDYYFYKWDPNLSTTLKAQINNTRFSDVIKRNTTLTNLQNNVFFIEPCPGEDGEDRTLAGSSSADGDIVIKAYPNPVRDALHLDLSSMDESCTIRLISTNGIMVKSINAAAYEKDLLVDMKDCAPGVYILNIISGRKMQSLRVVKLAI